MIEKGANPYRSAPQLSNEAGGETPPTIVARSVAHRGLVIPRTSNSRSRLPLLSKHVAKSV